MTRKNNVALLGVLVLCTVLSSCNKNKPVEELPSNPINNIKETINYGNELEQMKLELMSIMDIKDTNTGINDIGINDENNEKVDINNENNKSEELINGTNSIGNELIESLIQEELTGVEDNSKIYGGITRFQGVMLVYKTLMITDTIPLNIEYSLNYNDLEDIPLRYKEPIRVANSIGIMKYDGSFDGYTFISKDELSEIIDALIKYISNFEPVINNENESNDNTDNNDGEEVENKDILSTPIRDREPVDRLNGTSVAIHKEPKTIGELKENIAAIEEVNMTSERLAEKYDSGENGKVEFEYINFCEGLDNWDEIHDYSECVGDGDKDSRLIGITTSSVVDLQVLQHNDDGGVIVTAPFFNLRGQGLITFNFGIFEIKDNKIVGSGEALCDYEHDIVGISLEKNDFDTIGIIVPQIDLENESSKVTWEYFSEPNYPLVMILYPLSSWTLNQISEVS